MSDSAKTPALVCGEIGLIRSLGRVGVPVYAGSYYKDHIAFYSRYVKKRLHFEPSLSHRFVEQLVGLGKSEKHKMVFFSDDDRVILTFSQNRNELEPYYHFNLPDASVVDALLDKRKFAALAEEHNLPVPRSFIPASADEVERTGSRLEFPVIVKPAHKDYWWDPKFLQLIGPYRKAIVCHDLNSLTELYGKVAQINPAVVVQEYVEGDDNDLYSVNIYICSNSDKLGYFIGHKERVYPIHAGIATVVETIRNDEVGRLALDIAKELGLKGHVNIQFKRDSRTGEYKIMEMHARNSLWAYLGTASGLNLTAMAYRDMLGLSNPEVPVPHYGTKWIDFNKDLKALFDYRKAGELKTSTWLKAYRGRKAFHIHSLRDPMPFFMDTWFYVQRHLSSRSQNGTASDE